MKTINKILLCAVLLTFCINAKDNSNKTILIPHLNVNLKTTNNIVYAPCFHFAWKQLQNNIIGDAVKTERPLKLVSMLNECQPTEMNKNDYISLSGFAGNGIDKIIYDSMQTKFNMFANLSNYVDDPFNIICYSYFRKNLEFNTKFESFDQLFPFFHNGKSTDVNYFGIWTAGMSSRHLGIRKQVKIVEHTDANNFVISISNPEDNDEVIIAMMSEFNSSVNLASAVKLIMNKISESSPGELVDNDRLLIPKIQLDLEHEYDELYGVHLANEGYKDYFFTAAINNVAFRLNESGAFADSEAKLILKKGPGPRTMIVNKPFLLLMKEKTSRKPYLAAWIVNPDLLVKADLI
jgi:hypothetical protein